MIYPFRVKFNDDGSFYLDHDYTKMNSTEQSKTHKIIKVLLDVSHWLLFPVIFLTYGLSWYLLLPILISHILLPLTFMISSSDIMRTAKTIINQKNMIKEGKYSGPMYIEGQLEVDCWPFDLACGIQVGWLISMILTLFGV